MFSGLTRSAPFVLCAVLASAVSPSASEAEEVPGFHYKQWQAACGPEYCALTPRANPFLSLVRANAGGHWALSFHEDVRGTILIDGVEMGWAEDVEMPFPAPLLDGDVLELHYDAEGFSDGVSLAGIKAALIWAEEQQGQGGDRTLALSRPDWAALKAQARAMTEEVCEGPLPDMFDNVSEPQIIWGHPEVLVLAQTCWTAAYNVGSHVYLLGPVLDGVDPVRVAAIDETGTPTPELALWGLEGNSPVLESYYKGRGLGDCFSHETWEFDGFHYRLKTRVVDDECDEKIIPMVVWPE